MNDDKILEAYRQCAEEEIKLSKLEQKNRALQLQITKTRQSLVQKKDNLAHIHREISEPIIPFMDGTMEALDKLVTLKQA